MSHDRPGSGPGPALGGGRRQPAPGRGLWPAPPAPAAGLHAHRPADHRHRHRDQHGDLQPDRRALAAAAPGAASGAARRRRRSTTDGQPLPRAAAGIAPVVSRLRGPPRPDAHAARRLRVGLRAATRCGTRARRRRHAPPRPIRLGELLHRARRAGVRRPHLHRRRGSDAGRRPGRRPELRVLGARVRRRPWRHRWHPLGQRRPAHDRRRCPPGLRRGCHRASERPVDPGHDAAVAHAAHAMAERPVGELAPGDGAPRARRVARRRADRAHRARGALAARARDAYRTALLTLMAAVGLVLLVVCANVANLLLARAVAQVREISVRMAIGAGRWRLVQLALTESLLLAVGGAALGLAVAVLGSRALLRMGTGVTLAAGLDGRVLAFTAALSLGTAILVGTLPAFRGTRLALATALRTQGRSVSGPSLVLGRYLVVAQVALSMTLVVGAGMLARSTIHLAHADVGVARDNLLIATIDAQRAGYTGPRLLALMRDLTGRALAVPGVAAATLSEDGLFNGRYAGTTVQIGGFSARADSDTTVAEDAVGPGYFHAVGAHILRGRDIDAHDNETAPRVAVVNASFAHFFFPRGDALGQHVLADSATWEIVGIVADIRQNGIRDAPARRLYVPIFQATEGVSEFRVVVRAEGDPARLTAAVQGALSAPDPSVAVLDVEPLDSLIGSTIQGDRLVATMVSLFGVLALVLAALGLYGVTAYTTVRRTAEFGLRMALGAAPAAVARMVLREAALLTGLGIAIGLTVALAAAHLVEAQLYGIGLFDPPSVGLAIVVLGLSGTLAACLPASRAMRIAPLDAIHTE